MTRDDTLGYAAEAVLFLFALAAIALLPLVLP